MWVGKYTDNHDLAAPLTFSQRVKSQRHMKKKTKGAGKIMIFFLGALAFLLIAYGGYYFFANNKLNIPSVTSPKEPEFVSFTSYYVAQTKFQTLEESIKLEDLKAKKLYFSKNILSEELDSLKTLLSLSETQTIDPGFDSFKALPEGSILITYPHESDFRLKTLDVDGVSLWTKDVKLEDYSLQSNVTISKDKEGILADRVKFAKINQTTMFVGGEIIASRAVDRTWLNTNNNNIEILFDRLKPNIQSADVALAMIENSYQGNPTPCHGCVTFVSDEALVPQFKSIGLDVLSLAGNHEGDGGKASMQNTRDLMDKNDIKHFGSGKNTEEASKYVLIEANGIKFAFMGADDIAYFYWAGPDTPGTNHYSTNNGVLGIDREKIKKDIEAAKKEADQVVIMMSWGIEYQNYATKHQEEMAQVFVDSGADIIVSSHPHWVQNAQVLTSSDGKVVPVFYSLGNFIFDQTHTDPTRQSIATEFNYYNGKLVDINVIPFQACGYHQTQNNLATKVISGEVTYEQIDAMSEKQGCVWWQPVPLGEGNAVHDTILTRFFEHTNF